MFRYRGEQNEIRGFIFAFRKPHSSPIAPPEPFDLMTDAHPSLIDQLQAQKLGNMAYLDGLNPEQYDAATSLDGSVLVLAGAGTGKTRALTTRIAHILATGRANPHEILAVTFTNKAAREMRERIAQLLGQSVEGMAWLGTFHSVGAKLLRRHAALVGLKSDFTILDTDDQIRLLKRLLEAHNIDTKRWPAKQLSHMIDQWKNKGLNPQKIAQRDVNEFANGKAAQLYDEYQVRLKILNAVDFGDLLLLGIHLFTHNSDVLTEFHRRFKFILVDEYQDINVAQYLWLRLLAQRAEPEQANICVVGDDDQSIYGWRGAEVSNILRFEKDFPGAKTIRLERNYRSTATILRAASELIAHNQDRLGKVLHTDVGETGDKIKLVSVWDSEEEARQIGDDIEQLEHNRQNLDEIAILVRASFQMREIEDRFITLGLNYRVIGGPRFYERREIRDALAYLRIVAQPANDMAFERIFNTPKRGLGETTLNIVYQVARSAGIPLTAAAAMLIDTEDIKPKQRRTLNQLLADMKRWRDLIDTIPHPQLAEQILDESGYTQMWQNERSADAPGRLENLKELVRSMEEFDNLAGFLEHISLVMDTDTAHNQPAVSIMTLHAAKGLEFDHVFLPGWEEGLFPHQRSLDEQGRAGLEEERRLAYVGLTRAKKTITLSLTQNRRIHGLWQSAIPSRFLDELPRDTVDLVPTGSTHAHHQSPYGVRAHARSNIYGGQRYDSDYQTPNRQRAHNRRYTQHDRGPRTIDGELVARSVRKTARYNVDDKVRHLKFGVGTVTAAEGNKLTIEFENGQIKKVLDHFVYQP